MRYKEPLHVGKLCELRNSPSHWANQKCTDKEMLEALDQAGGNQSEAARMLGVGDTVISSRIRRSRILTWQYEDICSKHGREPHSNAPFTESKVK